MPMMRKSAAKPDPIVKSAARAIGILRLFSERQVPLGVCDVSAALDYPNRVFILCMGCDDAVRDRL